MPDMNVKLFLEFAVFVHQPLDTEIVFRERHTELVLVQLAEFIQRHSSGGNPLWYKWW
ncbi:hypothetical protein ATJ93_3466 [Halopiger aswanensis]|uniref:Uncharacterized protein n=1 Tax=Halopiger aswanensis TaxID=148449 RepID=A0A3R7HWX4_9EURY|nr:hypothetical protein ATJ93_3466 [Halopiger aswanensis]